MTDREKLVAEMAKVLLELQPEKPIYSISMSSRAAVLFADAMLKVAERELAEKHARIVEDMLSDYCDVTRRVIAAAIRATVEKKDD